MSALCTWLFEDKRATTCLMLAWMVITCVIFWFLGAFHIQFMTFGPSTGTMFMGMTIDTWPKWSALASFSFWNTAMNEFLGSALGPWFVNTIQDHKSRYLPYSKAMCLCISQAETLYGCIMGIFGIFLFFSQIDFLLIRALAELSVNHYTTNMFMAQKEVDRGGYEAEKRGPSERMDESKLLDRHHDPGDDMGS